MLTVSLLIPTFNRPVELRNCVESVLTQTRRPEELIVIDDGNLEGIPLRSACEQSGIRCVYHKKAKPGLTESRNQGVALATGDIIGFLDDDVVLYPEYIEELLKVYEADTERRVGGVGGVIVNYKPLTRKDRVKRIFDILFLISGRREGTVLPSGFCVNFGSTGALPDVVSRVDFLSGGVSSFRSEVFRKHAFTDAYRDFGFGEDKDFSYQVSREQVLMLAPKARLLHFPSPAMRPDRTLNARKFLIGRYLFFRDHVKRGWWSWAFFSYALFGFVLTRSVDWLLAPDRGKADKVKGMLQAVRDIVGGKVLLPR